MQQKCFLAVVLMAALGAGPALLADDYRYNDDNQPRKNDQSVQLGPRPFYLVEGMDSSALKSQLLKCEDGPFSSTDFSIGHRGAAQMFPEHTDVSYKAAARMGAGIVECDVTFTADGKLVCRHDECDLSTTTNITSTPLNGACTIPWSPGIQSPKCCTSDISSNQFKILSPKMDASVPGALTPQIYQGGTADWRTDLYVGRANVMTLKESIALNESLGVKHTPELKAGDPARIKRVFGSQANYAKAMVETFIQAGISPKNVFMQSFNLDDVLYWVKYYPAFGRQAVYLDDVDPTTVPATPRLTVQELRDIRNKGVRTLAPPMWALLAVQNGQIVPSQYAKDIQAADLDIIAWTFERADLRKGVPKDDWYYQFDPNSTVIKKDSDMYKALDVLAKQVKIKGIFSDWPATVTFYANCMGLK